jgi:hypothetical protein
MPSTYVHAFGGLDQATTPLEVSPSSLIEGFNFFEEPDGGYSRILGYERFDGKASPSSATYFIIEIDNWDLVTNQNVIQEGLRIDILTSSFHVLRAIEKPLESVEPTSTRPEPLRLCVVATDMQGPELEIDTPIPFNITGSIISATPRAATDDREDAEFLALAADFFRQFILPVPGVDDVIGVAQIDDSAIAWRGQLDGSLLAFLGTGAGWQQVKYPQLVALTANNVRDYLTLLNNGQYQVSGIYPYIPDGQIQPDQTRQVLAVIKTDDSLPDLTVGTILSVASDGSLAGTIDEIINYRYQTGGKIRSINHNFFASENFYRCYFTDGINFAGEYLPDLNCINPITENYRNPSGVYTHLIAHNARLVLSQSSSIVTSVAGEPHLFDGFLGSQQIGVGDRVTGFRSTASDRLIVTTRRTTRALIGRTIEELDFPFVSTESGAFDDCIQAIDEVLLWDDRGINILRRTEVLGGFLAATLTDRQRTLMADLRLSANASVSLRNINQVRFFAFDRFVMVSRIIDNNTGNFRYSVTEGQYPNPVVCVASREDERGNERILYGSNDGFVYEMDKGISFDGQPVEAFLQLHFNHLNSPYNRKRYRHADVELRSRGFAQVDIDYAIDDGRNRFRGPTLELNSSEQGWDFNTWDIARFDSFDVVSNPISVRGSGKNFSMIVSSNSVIDAPYTFTGYLLRYSQRGQRAR